MKYDTEQLEEKLDELKSLDQVNDQNTEAIQDFYQYLTVDSNVGNERIYKYLTTFKTFFDTNEEYSNENFISKDVVLKKAEKDDIREIVSKIQRSEYSEWSKSDFKVALKKFYNTIWEDSFDRPKRVKKILSADFLKKSTNIENKKDIEALTASEIKQMSNAANNPRDKLLPVFMFETGARIGEITGRDVKGYEAEGVKLKHIDMKQKYADVEVETLKNNRKGTKTLQLVRSVGLLQDWLEQHPDAANEESNLFVNLEGNRGKPGEDIGQRRISDILKELADRADVDKPIRNHVFRHSSATFKGTEKGWNVQKMMYWHGWSDPKMAKQYCKENDERMKAERLEEAGIEDSGNTMDDSLEITDCPRCDESVDPFSSFCPNCSLALDQEAAAKSSETSEEVKEDLINEIKEELGWSDEKMSKKIREKVREANEE